MTISAWRNSLTLALILWLLIGVAYAGTTYTKKDAYTVEKVVTSSSTRKESWDKAQATREIERLNNQKTELTQALARVQAEIDSLTTVAGTISKPEVIEP